MPNIPYEGYSYYIDSDNAYHFNVVIPYSTYNYRVEVLSPVVPIINGGEIVLPDITLSDFQTWVRSSEGLIDSEDHALYPLYELLIDIGKQIVRYELCGSDNAYIRAVSYYVAHYLQLHIKALKDEEAKMSLTPEEASKQSVEDKKIEMLDSTFGNFKQTIWGQMFWSIYGNLGKFSIGYVPL